MYFHRNISTYMRYRRGLRFNRDFTEMANVVPDYTGTEGTQTLDILDLGPDAPNLLVCVPLKL